MRDEPYVGSVPVVVPRIEPSVAGNLFWQGQLQPPWAPPETRAWHGASLDHGNLRLTPVVRLQPPPLLASAWGIKQIQAVPGSRRPPARGVFDLVMPGPQLGPLEHPAEKCHGRGVHRVNDIQLHVGHPSATRRAMPPSAEALRHGSPARIEDIRGHHGGPPRAEAAGADSLLPEPDTRCDDGDA